MAGDRGVIFLSYNHGDDQEEHGRRASALQARLEAAGYDVRIDKRVLGGEDFVDWINEHVEAATLVVALWSKRSLGSEWCRYEAQRAHADRKLFPITLEEITDADVPKFLYAAAATALKVPYEAPDLLEQIAARVQQCREAADRKQKSAAAALLASRKTHLPEVLAAGQPDLFGRDVEESLLLDAFASCAPGADPARKTNLVVLHAIGGAGKTALMRRMVDRLAESDFPHVQKVIGWSAYSQGAGDNRNADADGFITEALAMMGFTAEPPKDSVARARALATLMQRTPTLLLLDGIEPLQSPPHVNLGRLKDKGLAALLIELARNNPGLAVVTSRQELPETAKIARVRTHALDELAPAAGAALLQALGCWGAAKDLEKASAEADGHALTITALGGYIAAVEDGDIRKRDHLIRLADVAFTAEEMAAPDPTVRAAKKAGRVIEGYIAAFEEIAQSSRGEGVAERMLLNIVGLFDRPADGEAVGTLLSGEPIAGLTDAYAGWTAQEKAQRVAAAKRRLRELKLLAGPDPEQPDALDAHPIVRAHFSQALKALNPEAHRAAHARLYRMYAAAAPDRPDTVHAMTPLFHAIGHACAAGLHQEAFADVYWKRVRRGNEAFINTQLGAYAANLGALAHFFDRPWGAVSENLTPPDRAAALNYAAFSLRALGRLEEAAQAESASFALRVAQKDWKNAAAAAGNVSELRLAAGDIAGAVEAGAEAVTYADRAQDAFQMMLARTAHADALAQAGRSAEAEALFRDAEARQAKREPHLPRLYALGGYQYCDFLLARGRAAEARERAAWMMEGEDQDSLLDKALYRLADGRTLALLAAHGQADPGAARARLDAAIDALREAGDDDLLPLGLLARAEHLRRMGAFADAARDLGDALDIAERGRMKLFLADCALEAGRLALAQIPAAPPETLTPLDPPGAAAKPVGFFAKLFGAKEASRPAPQALSDLDRRFLADAEAHWAEAARLVQETGYRRRDGELADLRARIDALR